MQQSHACPAVYIVSKQQWKPLCHVSFNYFSYREPSRALPVDIDMDGRDQAQVCDTHIRMPPSYSQLDLQHMHLQGNDTQNQHGSAATARTDPSGQQDALAAVTDGCLVSDAIVQQFSIAFQVFQNAGSPYINRGQDSIEPPLDDSDAPPSYDEATASPV